MMPDPMTPPLSPRARDINDRVFRRYLEGLNNAQEGAIKYSDIVDGDGGILVLTDPDTVTGREIEGTPGRITVTNGTGILGDPAINIDPTYVGQDTITTLGTIGSGTWQATPIANNYIANSAVADLSGINTGDQSVFKTISIAGQSDVIADNTADTLTYVAGTGMSLTTNATTDTITWTCNITQYTNEDAQDAVGTILTDTATIDFTYNDAGNTITADVKDGSITEDKQVLADNTTNNASTSKHGYLKKLDNDATHFMNGQGNWTAPAGSGTVTSVATAGLATGGTITTTGTITVTAAVASDMETATSTAVAVVPAVQQRHPGHPKAWLYLVYSGGTPTAGASYNVSSITDTAVGVATVNLTTAFSSTNYSLTGDKSGISNLSYALGVTISSSSAYVIDYFNDVPAHADGNSFSSAFGDQ